MRFVGSKGLWVWVPERPLEPCTLCVAVGENFENSWHWFVDCPRYKVGGGGEAGGGIVACRSGGPFAL